MVCGHLLLVTQSNIVLPPPGFSFAFFGGRGGGSSDPPLFRQASTCRFSSAFDVLAPRCLEHMGQMGPRDGPFGIIGGFGGSSTKDEPLSLSEIVGVPVP